MKALPALALSLVTGLAHAEPPPATDLVEKLASPQYRVREKAADELIHLGRIAKPALVAGASHPDAEVRDRCRQLLPQALALDLKHRIDRFTADSDAKLDHDLPLLKSFQKSVGSDAAARDLYGKMLAAEGTLLEAIQTDPKRTTELVQRRYQEIYEEVFGLTKPGMVRAINDQQLPALDPHQLSAVLFGASLPEYQASQPDWVLSNLYTQPGFTARLKDEKGGAAYRKLLFRFLDARMDDNNLHQCIYLLQQWKSKEGVAVVAKALAEKKPKQVYTRALAIGFLGVHGTKDDLKSIEVHLTDDATVQSFAAKGGGPRGVVKVKDVALAVTIHLNGKNPKEFGFTQWTIVRGEVIQYHRLGFATEEERTAAFKKWADGSKQ